MLITKLSQKPAQVAVAHLNDLLDEALQETFPASDPIAVTIELGPSEAPSKSARRNTHGSSGWHVRD